MQAKWWRSGFFYLLLLIVVIALIFAFMPGNSPENVELSDFVQSAREGQIDIIS
jgi:uncharacterized protein YpmS